eukprot:9424325-Alexandrium_andersonii.AAC.1
MKTPPNSPWRPPRPIKTPPEDPPLARRRPSLSPLPGGGSVQGVSGQEGGGCLGRRVEWPKVNRASQQITANLCVLKRLAGATRQR